MLVFLPPSEELLPALERYRRDCLTESGISDPDALDGTAGLGNFRNLADWLSRVRLLASPATNQRGWFRTEVFLAVRIAEGCSLAARRSEDSATLPDLVGMGNVRFPGDSPEDERAVLLCGHIGYHVRPSERRKGYGSAILSHAAELCRKGGIPNPAVCVNPDNLPSLRTALACGFVREARESLPNGEEILRLRLRMIE